MKFLRLSDPLISVLFENEDIIALDKPYGFNTHTNDSKIEHSEFIQDGLIELLEKQFQQKLFIIHRLDQTTTGVIIFGKTAEAAKTYAEYFFDRLVKKTYLFITANKSSDAKFVIDKQIIHKGKELEAKTDLKFLKKSKNHELWQANPKTGRNHQIRIHAEAAGISILGDDKYGGSKYPFLCLHNRQIEFPNGIIIQSKPPEYFENLDLLEDETLAKALFEIDRRYRLFPEALKTEQSLRLAHIKKEPGYTLDQLGKNLILNWQEEGWKEQELKSFSKLSAILKKPIFVRFPKAQLQISPKAKTELFEATWISREENIRFEIKGEQATSGGLFLNQRLQRNWVKNHSKNKVVLNLFSGNCSLSVAAAVGLAKKVTSVDISKNALSWGRKNFELNGLSVEAHQFLNRDSITFLKQCLKKDQKFDLLICEAPSFARYERTVFKIEKNIEELLTSCLQGLNESGDLLFSTAFEGFVIDDLRQLILKVQKSLRLQGLEVFSILPALDFELPDERAILKSFLIRKMKG